VKVVVGVYPAPLVNSRYDTYLSKGAEEKQEKESLVSAG